MKYSLIILTILWNYAWAFDLNLRVEVSAKGVFEQQGLLLSGEEVTMVRNSNFFCPSTKKVILGQMSLSLEKFNQDRIKFIQLTKKDLPQGFVTAEKEKVKIFVDSAVVNEDHYLFHMVTKAQEEICQKFENITDSNKKELASIELEGNTVLVTNLKNSKVTRLKKSEACTIIDGQLRCTIPKWGMVTFEN